jgi:hypothetical protein
MTTLLDAFLALPTPADDASYSAEIDRGRRYRVGRSAQGHPMLLLSFSREGGSSAMRLATLEYRPPADVEIVGESRTARLAILECKTADPQLVAYFFRVANAVVVEDNRTAIEAYFATTLDAIVSLFRALQRPGLRTVQGLWAELAVIAWARQPNVAISAWHSDPHELHDFSAGSFRLEIKSTVRLLREHSFLLDQLSSMDPGTTLIASLLLIEDKHGTSLGELVELVRARVSALHDVQRRLEVIVGEGLGQSWKDADDVRYNLGEARTSLRIYRTEQIPTVPQPLPAGVRDVRFTADLSSSLWLDLPEARSIADLFADLLPEHDHVRASS